MLTGVIGPKFVGDDDAETVLRVAVVDDDVGERRSQFVPRAETRNLQLIALNALEFVDDPIILGLVLSGVAPSLGKIIAGQITSPAGDPAGLEEFGLGVEGQTVLVDVVRSIRDAIRDHLVLSWDVNAVVHPIEDPIFREEALHADLAGVAPGAEFETRAGLGQRIGGCERNRPPGEEQAA